MTFEKHKTGGYYRYFSRISALYCHCRSFSFSLLLFFFFTIISDVRGLRMKNRVCCLQLRELEISLTYRRETK